MRFLLFPNISKIKIIFNRVFKNNILRHSHVTHVVTLFGGYELIKIISGKIEDER
jgi:hypothetical protein